MVTEEITPITPERFEAMERERERNLMELMDELMAPAGIESFEELHRRFIATEHAYVPVPGLHRGKPVSLELFKRIALGRVRAVHIEYISGMLEVLGIDRRSKVGTDFVVTYTFGERRGECD